MNLFLHCVAASSYSSCSPGFVCFAYGSSILTAPPLLRLAPAGSECPKPRREAPEAAWRTAAGNETAARAPTTTTTTAATTTPRSRTRRTQVGRSSEAVDVTAFPPQRRRI